MIAVAAPQHALQPCALLGDGLLAPAAQLLNNGLHLGTLPPGHALTKDLELASSPRTRAGMGDAQEVEGLGFALASCLPLLRCVAAKFDEPGLFYVQLQ
jgi:hypothetical protein